LYHIYITYILKLAKLSKKFGGFRNPVEKGPGRGAAIESLASISETRKSVNRIYWGAISPSQPAIDADSKEGMRIPQLVASFLLCGMRFNLAFPVSFFFIGFLGIGFNSFQV